MESHQSEQTWYRVVYKIYLGNRLEVQSLMMRVPSKGSLEVCEVKGMFISHRTGCKMGQGHIYWDKHVVDHRSLRASVHTLPDGEM